MALIILKDAGEIPKIQHAVIFRNIRGECFLEEISLLGYQPEKIIPFWFYTSGADELFISELHLLVNQKDMGERHTEQMPQKDYLNAFK